MRHLLISTAVLAMVGCGNVIYPDDTHEGSAPNAAVGDPSPPASITDPEGGEKTFQGYVGGAFAVTVDNNSYSDMEDFYTKEEAALPAKVKAAGYDASWTAKFDAEVGLQDLWRNMTVYIAPEANTGYQGTATVGENGNFSVTLPDSALGHEYKVRANKRIGIILTRGAQTVDICYNFSALERSVAFNDTSMPIILDTFQSTVTSYACGLAPDDGLKVPAAEGAPTALAVGETKSDVARIMGLTGLYAASETQWCWAYRPAADSPCTAKKDGSPNCDCSVTFDANGTVTAMDGIAASYLK